MSIRYAPDTFRITDRIGQAAKGFFRQSLDVFEGRLPDAEFELFAELHGDKLLLVADIPAPVGRIEFTVQDGYWCWAKNVSADRQD